MQIVENSVSPTISPLILSIQNKMIRSIASSYLLLFMFMRHTFSWTWFSVPHVGRSKPHPSSVTAMRASSPLFFAYEVQQQTPSSSANEKSHELVNLARRIKRDQDGLMLIADQSKKEELHQHIQELSHLALEAPDANSQSNPQSTMTQGEWTLLCATTPTSLPSILRSTLLTQRQPTTSLWRAPQWARNLQSHLTQLVDQYVVVQQNIQHHGKRMEHVIELEQPDRVQLFPSWSTTTIPLPQFIRKSRFELVYEPAANQKDDDTPESPSQHWRLQSIHWSIQRNTPFNLSGQQDDKHPPPFQRVAQFSIPVLRRWEPRTVFVDDRLWVTQGRGGDNQAYQIFVKEPATLSSTTKTPHPVHRKASRPQLTTSLTDSADGERTTVIPSENQYLSHLSAATSVEPPKTARVPPSENPYLAHLSTHEILPPEEAKEDNSLLVTPNTVNIAIIRGKTETELPDTSDTTPASSDDAPVDDSSPVTPNFQSYLERLTDQRIQLQRNVQNMFDSFKESLQATDKWSERKAQMESSVSELELEIAEALKMAEEALQRANIDDDDDKQPPSPGSRGLSP